MPWWSDAEIKKQLENADKIATLAPIADQVTQGSFVSIKPAGPDARDLEQSLSQVFGNRKLLAHPPCLGSLSTATVRFIGPGGIAPPIYNPPTQPVRYLSAKTATVSSTSATPMSPQQQMAIINDFISSAGFAAAEPGCTARVTSMELHVDYWGDGVNLPPVQSPNGLVDLMVDPRIEIAAARPHRDLSPTIEVRGTRLKELLSKRRKRLTRALKQPDAPPKLSFRTISAEVVVELCC